MESGQAENRNEVRVTKSVLVVPSSAHTRAPAPASDQSVESGRALEMEEEGNLPRTARCIGNRSRGRSCSWSQTRNGRVGRYVIVRARVTCVPDEESRAVVNAVTLRNTFFCRCQVISSPTSPPRANRLQKSVGTEVQRAGSHHHSMQRNLRNTQLYSRSRQ